MPDALVTDLLPAGLEIENFNLGDAKQWAGVVVDGIEIADRDEAAEVRHEEYRDDRYVAALKLDTDDTAQRVLPGARGHAGHLYGAAVAGRGHVPPGSARRRQGQPGDVDGEAAGQVNCVDVSVAEREARAPSSARMRETLRDVGASPLSTCPCDFGSNWNGK